MEKIKLFLNSHTGYDSVKDAVPVINMLEEPHKTKVINAIDCLISQIYAYEKQYGQKDYVFAMQEYANKLNEDKKELMKDVKEMTHVDVAEEGCNTAIAVALKQHTYKEAANIINKVIDIKCICHNVKLIDNIQ